MADNKNEKKDFVNPIDKDKIAENPHLLPYAHTVGSIAFKPTEEGKIKSRAVSAMEHQTDTQLKQIYEQMKLLASQAEAVKNRIEISEKIYQAEMRFEPYVNHIYHLYETEEGKNILSMIAPDQWGRRGCPYFQFLATAKLLGDHTWEIISEE